MPESTTTYACGCQKIEECIKHNGATYDVVKDVYCGPHQAALTDAEARVARIRHDQKDIAHLPIIRCFCGPHRKALTAAEERVAQIHRDIAAQEHTITKRNYPFDVIHYNE
jgi:hypothetical protein